MSQNNFRSRVFEYVSDAVPVGGAVDVYVLAKHLQPQCGNLGPEKIAADTVRAGAEAGGATMWGSLGRDQP